MDKKSFLEVDEVQGFIAWMVKHIENSSEVLHSWQARSSKAAKKKGEFLEFFSIKDAFKKYYWLAKDPFSGVAISSFQENAICLSQLKEGLKRAIESSNAIERLQSYSFCRKTLEWGGVWQRRHIAKTIKSINIEILPYYLLQVRDYLHSAQDDRPYFCFKWDDSSYNLDIDSGTTKIYSLLSNDWIIYDGRVAAALGFLVLKWAKERAFDVPNVLRFSHPSEPHRNPNPAGERIFPLLKNDHNRLTHNLYANWLVQGILDKSNQIGLFCDTTEEMQSRCLEAALFMLGYCVLSER